MYMSYSIVVPNFKILGVVVPEKSLTEKKVNTHTYTNIVTEKTKTITPYILHMPGGIKNGAIYHVNKPHPDLQC